MFRSQSRCTSVSEGDHMALEPSVWFNEDLSSPFLCNELRFSFLNFKVLCRVFILYCPMLLIIFFFFENIILFLIVVSPEK